IRIERSWVAGVGARRVGDAENIEQIDFIECINPGKLAWVTEELCAGRQRSAVVAFSVAAHCEGILSCAEPIVRDVRSSGFEVQCGVGLSHAATYLGKGHTGIQFCRSHFFWFHWSD